MVWMGGVTVLRLESRSIQPGGTPARRNTKIPDFADFRRSCPLVRKGSNFESVFCGLSPPVSPREEMVSPYTF
jgi:hypothetical protein